ncbi:hypothetical protein BST61_g10255 [Cercospora zeina]
MSKFLVSIRIRLYEILCCAAQHDAESYGWDAALGIGSIRAPSRAEGRSRSFFACAAGSATPVRLKGPIGRGSIAASAEEKAMLVIHETPTASQPFESDSLFFSPPRASTPSNSASASL